MVTRLPDDIASEVYQADRAWKVTTAGGGHEVVAQFVDGAVLCTCEQFFHFSRCIHVGHVKASKEWA